MEYLAGALTIMGLFLFFVELDSTMDRKVKYAKDKVEELTVEIARQAAEIKKLAAKLESKSG
jgi:chemotaxis receptor (MCP) glutamine deamidase CheD